MGLKSHDNDYDRQVAEVNKERLFVIIHLAYRKSGFFIGIDPPALQESYMSSLPAMGGWISFLAQAAVLGGESHW